MIIPAVRIKWVGPGEPPRRERYGGAAVRLRDGLTWSWRRRSAPFGGPPEDRWILKRLPRGTAVVARRPRPRGAARLIAAKTGRMAHPGERHPRPRTTSPPGEGGSSTAGRQAAWRPGLDGVSCSVTGEGTRRCLDGRLEERFESGRRSAGGRLRPGALLVIGRPRRPARSPAVIAARPRGRARSAGAVAAEGRRLVDMTRTWARPSSCSAAAIR